MTRSARPPRAPALPRRSRRRSRRTPRRRMAMPCCSPTPNVRPTASASSPFCSRRDPPRPTSPPRSRCTSTTPLAAPAPLAPSTPTTSPPARTPRSPSRRHPDKPRSSPSCAPNSTPARPPRRLPRPASAAPTTTRTSASGQPATTTSSPAPTSRRARVSPPDSATRRVPARSAAALLSGAHGSDRTGPTCHPCHGETPAVFCVVQLRAARGSGRGQPPPRPVRRGVVDRCRGRDAAVRVRASRRSLTTVAWLVLAVLAVRTSTTEAPTPPADTATPTARLLGGSRIDYDVVNLRPVLAVPVDAVAQDGGGRPSAGSAGRAGAGGGCRWRGPGMTARSP